MSGCGDRFKVDDPTGRQGIKDEVRRLLSSGNCTAAIDLIEPLYNSEYTDNDVRLLRASAHGCQAGINYFTLLTDVSTTAFCISGNCNNFWLKMAEFFYYGRLGVDDNSDIVRRRLYSSWFATDALQAMIKEGVTVPPEIQAAPGTANSGSIMAGDRPDESNLYMVFVQMALLGATENLYGQRSDRPFSVPDYSRTMNFPWSTMASMTDEGCAYAGAVINFIDSSSKVDHLISVNFSPTFTAGLDAACRTYCTATCGYSAARCGNNCSILLKTRRSCDADDVAKCHAAGIINFIQGDALLGYPCQVAGCI